MLDLPVSMYPEQRTHRQATLWKIVRTDTAEFLFTDHDVEINYFGEIYTPVSAIDASARARVLGGDENDAETFGAINQTITVADIEKGLFENADVEERLVDWKYPFAGSTIVGTYKLSRITYSDENWQGVLLGLSRYMSTFVGSNYTRTCQNDLGVGVCGLGVDLSDPTFTYADVRVDTIINQRIFFQANAVDIPPGLGNEWFTLGRITWQTGANAGVVSEVMQYEDSSRAILLQKATPFDISGTDTFTISVGCDRTFATCRDKFDNVLNRLSFDYIPAADDAVGFPDSL